MTLAVPTIHLGGTSRQELLDQLSNAMAAVSDAEAALGAACPNGRDYYVQGQDAIQEALRQHANRLHNLRAVYIELNEIAEAVSF